MTSTPTLTEPEAREALATAEAEAAAADREAAALEQRVMAGDPSVTADQIEAQHGLARFAKLRIEAARARVTVARQTQVSADVDEAVALARTFAEDLEDLAPLQAAATEAFTALAEAWRKQQDEGRRVGTVIDSATVRAAELGVPGPFEVGRVRGNRNGINAPGVRWSPTDKSASALVGVVIGPAGFKLADGDAVRDNG